MTTFDPDQITAMALQEDGKLLAITGRGNDWRIARFHLGRQEFTLTASDSIDVLDNDTPNREPVAEGWQYGTPEDTPLNETLRASDPDGDPLTYSIVAQPAQGTVQITNTSTGAFTYTPPANFAGTISFTFRVNDGQFDSNTATAFVTVAAVNDAPVVTAPSALTTNEDTDLFVTGVAIADVDAGSANVVVTLSAQQGRLSVAANVSSGVTAG